MNQNMEELINIISTKNRPNIRIEIQNNLVEPMDVDTSNLFSDNEEEGEITESTQNVDITSKTGSVEHDQDELLAARAKRFQLDPNHIKPFNEHERHLLHQSLGITQDSATTRFEVIHMRGTQEMSTEDILQYFASFAPHAIEWISDEACNVVFNDSSSSQRALFYLSEGVRGMPVEGSCDPFAQPATTNRSILLVNNEEKCGNVHVSDITVPIPPGYWRLGKKHPKAKFILLRFALKSDKKPFKAERFSEYYKKYGNPNYGGLKGLVTESKKQQFKGGGIFDRHATNISINSKNPWGSLAKNWNADAVEENTIGGSKKSTSTLQHRLGVKRVNSASRQESSNSDDGKKTKMPRMRMYADDEEEKIKRKKQLNALKTNRTQDLRSQIDATSQKHKSRLDDDDEADIDNSVDLGTKLRNRKLKETLLGDAKRNNDTHRVVNDAHDEQHSDVDVYDDDDPYDYKTGSKVTVVIKRQKQPAVASTVWSRINTAAKPAPPTRKSKISSNSSNSSSSSSSQSSSSGSSNSDSESSNDDAELSRKERPGFSKSGSTSAALKDHKSPLRIEINNDLYRK